MGALAGMVGALADRPGASGRGGPVVLGGQLDSHPVAQGGLLLGTTAPRGQLTGPGTAGQRRDQPRVEADERPVQLRGGRPARTASAWRARTAAGLGVGMPSPWRPKALRSVGQV